MKNISASTIKTALSDMKEELLQVKRAAEDYLEELEEVGPKDILLDEEFEEGPQPKENEDEFEEKEKELEIETPNDAKKVLEEAKEDIQSVIDNIEGVVGQGEEEETKVAYKRINDKYTSSLKELSDIAIKAIDDGNQSLKHWAFLKKRIIKKEAKIDTASIKQPELKQAAETLQNLSAFEKVLDKLGYAKKSRLQSEATAVPPTGADFSGDKWPNKKNPAEVENRHWESGADKFNKDKKFEDSRPNPSVDQRLTSADYPRNDSPFVNASYNSTGNYYDIFDSKSKKAFRFSFANAPDEMGKKDEKGLSIFASKRFAGKICDAVIERGLESVRKEANGQYIQDIGSIVKQAASDKGSIRKYYTDAFGDPEYAKKLTSGQDNKEMDTEYKPKDDRVENNSDRPGFEEAKDGTGKISSKEDREVLKARAQRGLELARMAAAAGVINFDKPSVKKYAMEIMDKSDETITTLENTFNEMPLVNESALKEASIPDADSGIVGNRLSGVRDPKGAKSESEGVESGVASDAKIAKKASIVPQMSTGTPNGLQISNAFSTTEKRLKEKNVNLDTTRLRIARYRNS